MGWWTDEALDWWVYPHVARFRNAPDRAQAKRLRLRGYCTEGQLIGFDVAVLFASLHSLYC